MSNTLAEFARKSLAEGRGEWWIVSEMDMRWKIDESDARAIVASVSPGVYQTFLRRRRVYLVAGALLMLIGAIPIYILGLRGALMAVLVALPGAALFAYGWPGMKRRPRGDAPTSIPGGMNPVSPPLFRQDPFNWK